ncbi:MAG: hypothetical protein P9M15_05590, partial [Candidatus Electryoneaceae bacterium]|nr:hypothetical protein [Candidatus Electryoneaceae bacterium]
YRGRDERLIQLSEDMEAVAALELTDLYSEALTFKFSPDAMIGVSFDFDDFHGLSKRWGEIFLHVERLRTGKPFYSLDDYVNWHGIRESQQHGAGNLVRNLGRNLQLKKLKLRYPREELYRSLPKLLGLTQTSSPDWEKESERYLTVWNKFN